jgi:hypothetical protein
MSSFTALTSDTRQTGRLLDQTKVFATIAEALERIAFGSIQLTVHNGKLVQIDVTERHRELQ